MATASQYPHDTSPQTISLSQYLCACWQEVDRLMELLDQGDIQSHELAYLSTIDTINPEKSYLAWPQNPSLDPLYTAKELVKNLISYRAKHLAYYSVPQANFLEDPQAKSQPFWLGWGI
jgi:hypothetical protein